MPGTTRRVHCTDHLGCPARTSNEKEVSVTPLNRFACFAFVWCTLALPAATALAQPDDTATPPTKQTPPALPTLEAVPDVKRDDPATALFPAGAGYKIGGQLSPLGINSKVTIRENLHRVDDLLINNLRKSFNDPNFDPRSMLTEPVQVRTVSSSLIFDLPDRPDIPRFTFRYEDVEVDSQSSIALDFRQQVHEAAALWTTPYLGDQNRFRITIEPIYQYFRTSTDTVNAETRRDVHRGLVNLVLHDLWQNREFFFQALYGRADHKDVDQEEIEKTFRAEWRQWYHRDKSAFSTLGIVFKENEFRSTSRSSDFSREFELFGNLIIELDELGQWRWFNEISYIRRDIDAFLNLTAGSTNRVFDVYLIESRFTYEIIPDVDLSLGVEHALADLHDFDSLSLVARASIFNAGPFRAELGARRTFYYNAIDDELTTFFFELNFAQ